MTTLHNSLIGLETPDSRLALAQRVRDKAMELHELVAAKGVKSPHPWTRPRLYIETYEESYGLWYYLNVTAEDGQIFTLCKEPALSLATHANSPSTSYIVEFLLMESPEEQGVFMQDDARAKAFVHAERTLDQAIAAIKNDKPLDEHLSWREALTDSLTKQHSYSTDEDSWPRWFERWGTPRMAEAMNAASLLADPVRNYADWKALVLAAWQQETSDSHPIPENINDEQVSP